MDHDRALEPNDLERLFVRRANAGDIEGLMALYERQAIIADGERQVAIGQDQIRRFLEQFLKERPQLDDSVQAEPLYSGDIALTSSRLSNGDVTAEVARRQPDGSWRWMIDQFSLANTGSRE